MNLEHYMQRNILLLKLFAVSHKFLIAMAIIVPFFNELGLDQEQIFQLQSIFLVTAVLWEPFSGYFADVIGRRKSLIMGHLWWTAGWIVYIFADSFTALALAEVFIGLGLASVSGADDSLMYDSILAINDEEGESNLKQQSRASAYGAWGEGVAGLIGGILVLISLRTPIIAQAIWTIMFTPVVLMLHEAPIADQDTSKMSLRGRASELVGIFKYALVDQKAVKWLTLYMASLGSLTYTAVWLMQLHYADLGVSVTWFGALWFGKHLFLGFFTLKAEETKNWLGLEKALITLPMVGIATYVMLAIWTTQLWVLAAWVGFEIVRGTQFPVIRDETNKLIPSKFRATVMSVQGLVLRLFFAVFALIFGRISDLLSLQLTFALSAVIYGVLTLSILRCMLKTGHTSESEKR